MSGGNGVIGALLVSLGVDTAAFSEGLKEARAESKGFASDISSGLKAGMAGFAAEVLSGAGAIAAFGLAFSKARESMDWSAEIQRSSKLANSSAVEFQRMAAATQTVGIEQDELADILKDVNDRVGDFMTTGAGPMADFFEKIGPKIGVTAEQFRNLSGPQALQLYVSSLEKAGANQQEMTFFMEAMASNSTKLLPLLRDNGLAMSELGAEAQASGRILSDYSVDKLAKLQRETEIASRKINIDLKMAFMDLAPAIAGGAKALANFTGGLGDYARALEKARLYERAWMKGKFGADADKFVMASASLTDVEAATLSRRRGGVNLEATRAYVKQVEEDRKKKNTTGGGGGGGGASGRSGPTDFTKAGWDFEWQGPITEAKKGIDLKGEFKLGADSIEEFSLRMDGLPEKYDALTEAAESFSGELKDGLKDMLRYGGSVGDMLKNIALRWAESQISSGIDTLFKHFKIPGFATGTNYAPPGFAMVGERGPELVSFGGGERVFNASRTRDMMSGREVGGVIQNFYLNAKGAILADGLIREMQDIGVQAAFAGAEGGAELAHIQSADKSRHILE